MAQNSDMETRLCLVWSPGDLDRKRHSKSSQLTSPFFSFLGLQWCLTLYRENNRIKEIYLRKDPEEFALKIEIRKYFRVETFIYNLEETRLASPSYSTVVKHNNHLIWKSGEAQPSDISSSYAYGKQVACLFHGVETFVPKNKNKTIHIFNWSDLVLRPDLDSLSDDFTNLLKDTAFSDVKLRCGDCTISAHRTVLAARSEVFYAMFVHEMAETITGKVDIEDLDPQILDLMLKYMYTGKLGDVVEDTVIDVYKASDRYNVKSLKKECSIWMIRSLTEENCVRFFALADECSDNYFKDVVISFVCVHKAVLQSKSWLDFSDRPAKPVIEMYQRYIEYDNNAQPLDIILTLRCTHY